MTSKYPQMTTYKKASGQSPTKTIKGGSDFDKLLKGKSWLEPDKKTFEQLLKQPKLKKLPLKYILRRGISRLNPVDIPVRTAIWLGEQIWPRKEQGPISDNWTENTCGTAQGRGISWYRLGESCSGYCVEDPTSPSPDFIASLPDSYGGSRIGGYHRRNGACTYVFGGEKYWLKKSGKPGVVSRKTGMPMERWRSRRGVAPQVHPIAFPQPVPSKKPIEKAKPGEEPTGKPDEEPVYDLPVFDAPVVLVNPNGSGVRPQPRTQTWTFGGGLPPRYRERRGNPRNRRPNRRTKQSKPNIVQIAGKLWVVINAFTEGLDFVEVLWEALPDEMKRKHIFEFRYDDRDKLVRLSPRAREEIVKRGGFKRAADHQSMLEDLWKNWAHVDVAKTLTGYINNQVEDWFYGLMGKPTKALTQALGAATGVDHAIANAQKWSQKMYGANDEIENQYLISDLLPTVDFDPHTGDVTLTSPLGEVKFNLGDKVF